MLSGFRSGAVDPAELISSPLVVVDGDSPGDPAGLEVPPGFPAVVVALSESAAPPFPGRGPDVSLTGRADAPAPWVRSSDLQGALARLSERVSAARRAAVTLVEVLRAGRSQGVDEGLILESLAYSALQAGPEFASWLDRRPVRPPRPDTGPSVLCERVGDRLAIVLNRPAVHNAYNRHMRDELYQALAVAIADADISIVLSGAGPSFCSGGDLDEFGTAPDPASAHLVRTGRSPARLLADLAGRTEVLLHGSCAGSGIELPAFAGFVQAHPETRIWLPELAMGLIPGAGGTVSLVRRIGAGRTAWMALSGEVIDARTALRWGLVDGLSGESQ